MQNEVHSNYVRNKIGTPLDNGSLHIRVCILRRCTGNAVRLQMPSLKEIFVAKQCDAEL
jgi:hypothetical protein